MTNHPYLGLVDVLRRDLANTQILARSARELCRDRAPDRDGLPKFKDFPAEFGGSGETIPE